MSGAPLDRGGAARTLWWRRGATPLAYAGLAAVLAATLAPSPGPDAGALQWCLLCGELGLSDVIGNVALFVPLAVGLYWSGVSARRTVVLLFVLSACIEFVQLRLLPGRDSTLSDVAANTVGATLGVALAWWLPLRRRSTLRALAAAAASLAVMAGIGLVHRPTFPPTVYYGQWTADLGYYDWYRGKVLSAGIAGVDLPTWRLKESGAVKAALERGVPLRVRGIAGPAPSRFAPLFSLFDASHREIVMVGPDRGDLVLHVSTHAVDLRLAQPDLRWRGAMAGIAPGDTLAVAVRRGAGGYCLELNGRERCGLARTVGGAWELVQFIPHLPRAARLALDALAMVMLGLPVGLVARRGKAGYAVLTFTLAGTVVVPATVGLAPTPLLQLAALSAGFLAGAWVP